MVYSRTKDLVTLGRGERISELLVELAKILSTSYSRSMAFAQAFDVIKSLTDSSDPYAKVKAELNELGKKLSKVVERYLEGRNWNLREALRVSAAANIVDTSVLGYEAKSLEDALWDRPSIEEVVDIPRDSEVYLVLDNAGEAVIDLLLAKALIFNGYSVSVVVRRDSYEIDMLRNDLDFKDLSVIETPGNIPPVYYIDGGFIIAKGIANAEAYAEAGRAPSLHLLRAKCDVIAKLFGVPKNSVLIVSGNTIKKVFNA